MPSSNKSNNCAPRSLADLKEPNDNVSDDEDSDVFEGAQSFDENEGPPETANSEQDKSSIGENLDENDLIDDDEEVLRHPSFQQVVLDVNRCAGRLERMRQFYLHRTDEDDEPPEDLTDAFEFQRIADEMGEPLELDDDKSIRSSSSSKQKAIDLQNQRQLKIQLAKLIVRLLIKKQTLCYYQGFHDVCLTYMSIYGDREAFDKLDKLIDSHFYTFMQPTMTETQEFLSLLPAICGMINPRVEEFLEEAEVGTIFALSWVITWFSHVIPNQLDIEKVVNFLERSDPYMVLYLSAAIVLHKQTTLLELDPEMSTVHHYLCQVPRKEKLPIDQLIASAVDIFEKFPPDTVKEKMEARLRNRLQLLHRREMFRNITHVLGYVITAKSAKAIIVFALASALAHYYRSANR